MPLHLLNHPLGDHVISHLRDQTTKPATFRTLAWQISLLLALEATRHLPTRTVPVKTPLETCDSKVLAQPIAVIPILRSGLCMVPPFTDLFPDVSVGYIGLERDHETAEARSYYQKLPPLAGKKVLVVDPMLATGGSAVLALKILRDMGASDMALVCVVGAPEGVQTVLEAFPDLDIHLGVLDRQLNERKYILPGLGDFGDRLYGT